MHYFPSKVNKLKTFKINGERRLFKENKEVSAVSLGEAASNVLSFISQFVDRPKYQTNKNVETVLLGHNSWILKKFWCWCHWKISEDGHLFCRFSYVVQNTKQKKLPCLQNTDGTFPKLHNSSLYSFLFAISFGVHDDLEDVLTLRKIILNHGSNFLWRQ